MVNMRGLTTLLSREPNQRTIFSAPSLSLCVCVFVSSSCLGGITQARLGTCIACGLPGFQGQGFLEQTKRKLAGQSPVFIAFFSAALTSTRHNSRDDLAVDRWASSIAEGVIRHIIRYAQCSRGQQNLRRPMECLKCISAAYHPPKKRIGKGFN